VTLSGCLGICGDPLGEGRQRLVPRVDQPLLQRREAVWCQRVQVAGADAVMLDEAGSLQDLQVLADRRPADRELRRELAHGDRPASQPLDDATPGEVAEGIEDRFGGRLVTHEQRLL